MVHSVAFLVSFWVCLFYLLRGIPPWGGLLSLTKIVKSPDSHNQQTHISPNKVFLFQKLKRQEAVTWWLLTPTTHPSPDCQLAGLWSPLRRSDCSDPSDESQWAVSNTPLTQPCDPKQGYSILNVNNNIAQSTRWTPINHRALSGEETVWRGPGFSKIQRACVLWRPLSLL